MRYRKFVADHLFTGSEMLDDRYALVTDMEGVIVQVIPIGEAGDDVEIYKGILSPGFINCHCHLELSHMKGMAAEGSGMIPFLLTVMGARTIPLPSILQAIEEAETAMYRKGIVAVGDICNTDHTLLQKRKGTLYYHNFIETMGFSEATAEARFAHSEKLYESFNTLDKVPALQHTSSIVLHAPYSVSHKLFTLINDYPGNTLQTIHNQESAEENEFFRSGKGLFLDLFRTLGIDVSGFKPTGVSSLQHYLPWVNKKNSLILAHNTVTDKSDLEWLDAQQQQQTLPELYWCLCPNANLYITRQLPDISLLQSHPGKIVVGTDSLASNRQLDILEELKTIQRHFPAMTIAELLTWATSNGAEALNISNALGSFDNGKKPGVVHIEGVKDGKFLQDSVSRRIL